MTEDNNGTDNLVTLEDFKPTLTLLRDTKTIYCVVGGLAVGRWGEIFLKPEEKTEFSLPVRSKDLDIRAQKDAAVILTLHLRNEGAVVSNAVTRTPKNREASFPSYAVTVALVDKENHVQLEPKYVKTTVEALSGMPLLDQYDADNSIRQNGTALLHKNLYLLDPCSLLICKLNAIHTRPPGESDNDRKHATILSLVIPRFIKRTLDRLNSKTDKYHPFTDSERLAGFLKKEPWSGLIPQEEKERVLKSCKLAKLDWDRRKSMENPDR